MNGYSRSIFAATNMDKIQNQPILANHFYMVQGKAIGFGVDCIQTLTEWLKIGGPFLVGVAVLNVPGPKFDSTLPERAGGFVMRFTSPEVTPKLMTYEGAPDPKNYSDVAGHFRKCLQPALNFIWREAGFRRDPPNRE